MAFLASGNRYKTLVLQAVVLLSIILLTYKLAFPDSSTDNPNHKVIVEDNENNHNNIDNDNNNHNTHSKQNIILGTDPVIGRNILIENYHRQNATIMTLCQESDLKGVIETVRKLEDRFNKNYHYDWVFLNDVEYTDEFKAKVSKFVSGKARFGVIPHEHWSYPSFIDQEKAKQERERMEGDGVIYGGSESYRHMCRFNSGFFYKHPIMQEYKYYWRVEPHVEFTCDINYDPFKFMVDNNKIYGFTITIHEFLRTIETLWDTTKEFLNLHKDYLHSNNLINFISNNNGETYNLCHFWSNFEIADMDFWRSKEYEDYFQHLDKSGGFFYERWGDAPVHSIAISLFLDREKIHFFRNIGYRHGVYQMCPTEDELYDNNKCFCEKKNDFTFDGYACGKELFKAMDWKKPKDWEKYVS
jgi:alpha 1,2-mannosyltransferase